MEIRLNSGAVVSESEFRAMYNQTSLPLPLTEAVINSLGGEVVLEGPQASGGTVYQYSQRNGVEQKNGRWYTRYILGPVFTDTTDDKGVVTTAAQNEAAYKAMKDSEQAKSIRKQRTQMLKDTDWTHVTDAPGDNTAWTGYRRALRDVPSQAGFPWAVEWPKSP